MEFHPVGAAAQVVDSSLPEIPLVNRAGIGGRAMGMGMANAAVVEDASALFYNPAGLAQIRRIEAQGGISNHDDTRSLLFHGSDRETDLTNTQLSNLALAYPVPTYRGSLVLGIGLARVISLESSFFKEGPGEAPAAYEKETIEEEGGVKALSGGVAVDVSPSLSVGGTLSYLFGSDTRRLSFRQLDATPLPSWDAATLESHLIFDGTLTTDSDISGYTGSFGILAHSGDEFRIGLTVDFPKRFTFEGSQASRAEDQEVIATESFNFEDEITLPFSFLGGVAWTPPNFLIAADVRRTDWSQIDFEGRLKSDNQFAYRATTQIHLGAEYVIPRAPVRLRAGFYTEPLPYKLLLTDTRIDENGDDFLNFDDLSRDLVRAEVDKDRKYFTAGAGFLLAQELTLDVAYAHGSFERSGGGVSEEEKTNRVYVTAAFRF
jgi:long-chain fatty acid transport protein